MSQPSSASATTPPSSRAHDAVLLVNLGTPEAPTPDAVRRYLLEFLSDRRVVSLPPLLWQPILRGAVLPLRCKRVAALYADIWMEGGSPLLVHTRGLAERVAERLPGIRVGHAMRYGTPSLARELERLKDEGARRVLVLPLYPQYSTTTTASVDDVARRAALPVHVVQDYHLDPGWVEAVAASIRAAWQVQPRGEKLLFSFHGIPQRVVDAGDPYELQCRASTVAIARALGLADDGIMLTFQSRFGREKWLQPYTDATMRALGDSGVKHIDVVCPGFAVDCLETLEEIALQNAELFREHGGETLRYIPCLNADPGHADALAALVARELDGWTMDAR
ncbi:ferrochelatase [Luteimonas sp. MHLX1A]|uniref:ferrochelatase n=1 Tax=Alterluteimonas muca TaxID=2878684 RepID=UPI001E2DA788|nr:ferrochelatase [Luteimonas sp. MHLX1A]MCD9048065.1 ferrochelatase [Luteimonas sp. MHLX1A]